MTVRSSLSFSTHVYYSKPLPLLQCATKSIILHLQWQEEDSEQQEDSEQVKSATMTSITQSPTSMTPTQGLPQASTPPVAASQLSRTRTISALGRSTNSTTPQRRISLAPSTGAGASTNTNAMNKLKLSVSAPRTPTTPISPSPGNTALSASGLGGAGFPIRYGRATILTAPPKIVAIVETPDVAVGAVDPRKRRVVTATRFSSRAGADRRVCGFFSVARWQDNVDYDQIFMSTHQGQEKSRRPKCGEEENDHERRSDLDFITAPAPSGSSSSSTTRPPSSRVDIHNHIVPLSGAWGALADVPMSGTTMKGLLGQLPPKFAGLAMPDKNPMSMQLSHEEVVVGCADGTI